MGRSSGSVDQPASCRVLPIIDEEEPESSESPESEDAAAPERRKQAVVARMRELLRRAAAEQSAQSSRIRSSTLTAAKKWKRAVRFRINSRDDGAGARNLDHRLQVHGHRTSSSSSVSSKNSFSSSVDAVAAGDTLLSPARSPLWCPASVSTPSRNMAAQWITTDSDFVVLEL